MDDGLATTLAVVAGVPLTLLAYILGVERALRLVPERWQERARPWLWLAPALGLLSVFLVVPTVQTIVTSLHDKHGQFVGLANYAYFFSTDETLGALGNNAIWLVLLALLTVGGGVIIAAALDRVRYEPVAKSVLFMPLAMSAVGAGVIWSFMFRYDPPGTTQVGTLNGILAAVGQGPNTWLLDPPWNTVALIAVSAWIWTGFCMVILSASLKGISTDLLEAARVDGANELQVFRRITLPLLTPTIAVVATTMIITSLKAFDIVYVMTNGNFDTEVIANRMYKELFSFGQPGYASTVAVVLLLLVVPAMVVNIRRFRAQEAMR